MAQWLTSAVLLLSAFTSFAQAPDLYRLGSGDTPRAVPQTPTELAAPDLYRLGPGDTISIQVMGHPEYSLSLTIRPDGRVGYPTTGDIELTGLTTEQLRDLVRQSLADRLRSPEVSVNVIGFRAVRVIVLGAVTAPGPAEVPQEGLLLRDVLSRVGGTTPEADLLQAILYRSGAEPTTVNLAEEMAAPPGAGTTMQAGDLLYVPRLVAQYATIVGQVRTPGRVLLEPERTLLDYVLRVGGFAERVDAKHSRLIRGTGTVQEVDLSDLYSGTKHDLQLLPNDTLIVGAAEPHPPLLVLGQVTNAGSYPYDPTATLADLLTARGGLTRESDAKHSRILHQDGTFTEVDLQAVLDGQADDKLRGIRLQPGDILVVPKQMDRVALLGQVSAPGVYGFEKGAHLSKVLVQAGGVPVQEGKDKLGYLVRRRPAPEGAPAEEQVEVRRLDLAGVLFRGNLQDDIELQPEDLIYVPSDREPSYWEEVVRNPVSILGLLSLVRSVFR